MPAPSFDELFTLGKAEAILKRPELGVRIGDISEMLLSAATAMADRVIGWFAERVAATFLDGAIGDDLTLLAADHWAIQRRPAAKAVATVTFERTGADATVQTIAIGSTVATAVDSSGNDIRFLTTTAATWDANENAEKTVNVEAVEAGTSGNLSAIDLITRLISSPPAGGTYAVTASSLPAGGAEEETDAELRDRVRLYPSTLRRGTIAALEYGAKTIVSPAVAKASAIQDASGIVTVYVSDSSGNSTGETVAVGPSVVDDGTMTHRVAIELYDWVAAGALVNVSAGAVETVNINVTLTVRLGIDIDQLITDIQDSIEARVNRLNIGETLYRVEIINAAKAVDPDNILNVTVVSPAVDTAPTTEGNIIRAGTITVG